MAKMAAVPDLDAVEALSPFEGRDVVSTGVEMPGAAGGLRAALEVDPAEWHHGEVVHVVLECRVAKVRFDPRKGAEDRLERVHVLGVENATTVEEKLVRKVLDQQAKRIEEARGIQQLPMDDEGDDE